MSLKHVDEPIRRVPVAGIYDVIVCGGGPAGVAAAVAAARAGATTALIESQGCLGGVWTSGLMPYVLDSRNKSGLMAELHAELIAKDRPATKFPPDPSCYYPPERSAYDVELAKFRLEQLCLREGVRLRLHSRVCAVVCEDGGIKAAITESKSGREAWTGDAFVDATGDGDLAFQAGCRFDYGRADAPDEAQPMSLIAMVAGIELKHIQKYVTRVGTVDGGSKDLLRQLLGSRGIAPSYSNPSMFHVYDDLFILMANHQYGVSGCNSDDLTSATIEARCELHNLIDALRQGGEPWRNVVIIATGGHIGVCEGRRVRGLYTLTRKDLELGARFDDAVCEATLPVDIHETRKGKGKGREGVVSKPYQIPMRSLIAADVSNLMLAGRCVSGDFFAHASYRVTGNAVPMGEAAGNFAASAANVGGDMRTVRKQLN